ncbi:MAG: Tol-Pal system beta propeller repeat protein TolB [Pseudomonadota bacterium]
MQKLLATRILLAVFALILAGAPARALVSIDVTQGEVRALPIAIPAFGGSDPTLGAEIAQVVSADLQSSGLFAPLNPASFITPTIPVASVPRFPDWRAIGAEAVVSGEVDRQGARVLVNMRLWDPVQQEQVIGESFTTDAQNWRRVAHMVADAIYERLTGETGYFDTRIVFVAETGPKNQRIKRLAIMDQDGANLKYLTDGRDLVLTPRFSPAGQTVAYMSYEGGQPQVYLLDVETGQRQRIADSRAMSFAPRFSPDGSQVVMSLQEGANSNIFSMGVSGGQARRLTNSPAIDTSPSFSPDGQRIVFESDRGGSQQLYVMSASGGPAERISFGPGRYSTPVWSPKGDLIAFTRQSSGRFAIGVMRPDGSGERILTEGFHNEGPTWAPNGRVLAFFREEGPGSRIFTVDVTGRAVRPLQTPGLASDPAWSPRRR